MYDSSAEIKGELNQQTVVLVTGREKCNHNFIPKTLKEETTSIVGVVENLDIYRVFHDFRA